MLLELTTHPDKITRGAAINTVKRWIPDAQPMSEMIRDFALQLLRRLQSRPKPPPEEKPPTNGTDHDENMEDGQLPQEDIIQTPYLPEQLELPAVDAQILQHVELLFALSTKVPEFLDESVSFHAFTASGLPGFQDLCGVRRNGGIRTTDSTAADHPPRARLRAVSRETPYAFADIPPWRRVARVARAKHIHRARPPQRSARCIGEEPCQRARSRRAVPHPHHCRDGQST